MTTSSSVWSAVIAAVVSLAVFALTQVWTGRREKKGRSYERRRTALREGQDAALALRDGLAEYGPLARAASGTARSDALTAARQTVDEAFARLDVAMTRIDDAEVSAAVATWRERAQFHYISVEEVTTAEESALWQAMNDRFGAALVSTTGRA